MRTLSFWSPSPSVLESLVKHRWKTLRLVDSAEVHAIPLGESVYRTMFWADLQRLVLGEVLRRWFGRGARGEG